jgi:hypothetical protein
MYGKKPNAGNRIQLEKACGIDTKSVSCAKPVVRFFDGILGGSLGEAIDSFFTCLPKPSKPCALRPTKSIPGTATLRVTGKAQVGNTLTGSAKRSWGVSGVSIFWEWIVGDYVSDWTKATFPEWVAPDLLLTKASIGKSVKLRLTGVKCGYRSKTISFVMKTKVLAAPFQFKESDFVLVYLGKREFTEPIEQERLFEIWALDTKIYRATDVIFSDVEWTVNGDYKDVLSSEVEASLWGCPGLENAPINYLDVSFHAIVRGNKSELFLLRVTKPCSLHSG